MKNIYSWIDNYQYCGFLSGIFISIAANLLTSVFLDNNLRRMIDPLNILMAGFILLGIGLFGLQAIADDAIRDWDRNKNQVTKIQHIESALRREKNDQYKFFLAVIFVGLILIIAACVWYFY